MHRAEPKFPDKSFSSHELPKNRRERNNGGKNCFGSDHAYSIWFHIVSPKRFLTRIKNVLFLSKIVYNIMMRLN